MDIKLVSQTLIDNLLNDVATGDLGEDVIDVEGTYLRNPRIVDGALVMDVVDGAEGETVTLAAL